MAQIGRPSRPAKHVRVLYHNPSVPTRSGKLAAPSVTFDVDGRSFDVHTVYGVAKILRRSPARVQQLLETQKLAGHRIGRDWLVLDLDLRRFIGQERTKVRKRFASFLTE